MKLKRLTAYLDGELDIAAFPGDTSLNGLQVEGAREVLKVSFAVDACGESINRAVRSGAQMLIVHHGLFWGPAQPVTGIMAARLKRLLENGLSLYAAHLPLDCHPGFGNNAVIARSLGIDRTSSFGEYHGVRIGLLGSLPKPLSRAGLAAKVRRIFGGSVKTLPFGPERVRRLGIVSGGGASFIQAAAGEGCDTLLTGETSHSAFHNAREHGINLLFGGHYATETAGIRALSDHIASRFPLQVRFIDIPTGL